MKHFANRLISIVSHLIYVDRLKILDLLDFKILFQVEKCVEQKYRNSLKSHLSRNDMTKIEIVNDELMSEHHAKGKTKW